MGQGGPIIPQTSKKEGLNLTSVYDTLSCCIVYLLVNVLTDTDKETKQKAEEADRILRAYETGSGQC